ncbi:MAG TPA: GNAT family N-acetyltransferase [Microscillaceae bacterium]|nr:GNAT family N-acetyltransferase [Microscillaceae bacterium]
MILLPPTDYQKVAGLIHPIEINNLFARSVVEQHVTGKIYVDNSDSPEVCYVLHPYGMSLLAGNSQITAFNDWFRAYCLNTHQTRQSYEWMQAYPKGWDKVLQALFGEHMVTSADSIPNQSAGVVLNTRVNFAFDKTKYLQMKLTPHPKGEVVRTDQQLYAAMQGSVVPQYFWDDVDSFYENGIGFSVLYDGDLAATAYASFVHEHQLEIGIETVERFRGKGLAKQVCAVLIDHCLEHHYEPIWSCRLENTGSYHLALKLGFEPTLHWSYYRLGY